MSIKHEKALLKARGKHKKLDDELKALKAEVAKLNAENTKLKKQLKDAQAKAAAAAAPKRTSIFSTKKTEASSDE